MEEKETLRLAVIHFADIPNPRVERSKQHSLVKVIAIALSTVIAGAESFYEIEAFGQTKRAWLEEFLELENGIPSHDTFNRVFSLLEPAHFQACALDWVRAAVGDKLSTEDILLVDGKQLCGSATAELRAVHMLWLCPLSSHVRVHLMWTARSQSCRRKRCACLLESA